MSNEVRHEKGEKETEKVSIELIIDELIKLRDEVKITKEKLKK